MPADPPREGPVDRPAEPGAGRVVGGRYRLRSVLGRGGMGVVWAGRDELLQRDVAVKEVIPPQGVDPTERAALRARTMREARTAARISSDGAVAIYDVVEEDDRPWIVMERLPSRTLDDEIEDRGQLPPREVAEIGLALLAGLNAAHAAGILHRDVKPSNVMFRGGSRGGRAVLGDFGIAHFDGDSTLTSTGMVMGSPAYVAPERAHGKQATAASDLWSLGVTLWAALEGRAPFQRDNALATLTAVITEEAPPAEHAGPLAPVLEGLLRKDPARRMDAETARRQLLAVARHPTETAPLPSPSPPPPVTGAVAAPVELELPVPVRAPDPAPAVAPDPGTEPGSAPADEADAPTVDQDRRRARWLLPLLVSLVVLGLVALGAALLPDDDDPTASDPGSSPSATNDAGTAAASGTGLPSSSAPTSTPAPPSTQPTTPPSPDPAAVPEGFERYEDPTGFSVAVPEGWQAEREGPRVYLRDPDSSAYLLVDQTDDPASDPVADWQRQEPAVAGRLSNYERVGEIRAVDYRSWQAADWEFVFGQGQGTHVLNRNVITSPNQAYALYWSVPSSQWEAMLPVHQQVVAGFEPAG